LTAIKRAAHVALPHKTTLTLWRFDPGKLAIN
jgi:hypothetical protein